MPAPDRPRHFFPYLLKKECCALATSPSSQGARARTSSTQETSTTENLLKKSARKLPFAFTAMDCSTSSTWYLGPHTRASPLRAQLPNQLITFSAKTSELSTTARRRKPTETPRTRSWSETSRQATAC